LKKSRRALTELHCLAEVRGGAVKKWDAAALQAYAQPLVA
jgi:hypothetical protein